MATAAATKIKPTVIPKELRKQVRDGLRAARDIMNNDGTHWMQGDYKQPLLVPSGKTDWNGDPIMQRAKDAFMWCAVGGIREVATIHEIEAYCIVALAERGGLPPKSMSYLERNYQRELDALQTSWDWYENGEIGPCPETLDDIPIERKGDAALDVVTGWNDKDGRTWKEVSAAFTKAAASIK